MRDLTQWVIAAAVACAVVVLAASIVFDGRLDTHHAQFHAVIAVVLLGGSVVLLRARPALGIGARALMLGFIAFAVAQLVEAAGAFGFGADGYAQVNGMVALHDLGLELAAPGLLLFGAGVVVAVTSVGSSIASRWIPRSFAALVIGAVGVVVVGVPILAMMGLLGS